MLQDRAQVDVVIKRMTSREHYHSTVVALFVSSCDLNTRRKTLRISRIVLFTSMLELNLAHNLASYFVKNCFFGVVHR